MSVEHYENFPVASWLCPPALRPAVQAIYWFARTADDIADEGDATPAERLAQLRSYREALLATAQGRAALAWPSVFGPLQQAMAQHKLPVALLEALLQAFERDAGQPIYPDRAALLGYCTLSANPVGRLLLHLYGIDDARSLEQSDAICSALQLINFWQDLGVDVRRGRHYVPSSDAQRHGVSHADLAKGIDTPSTRALVAELTAWARDLMHSGAPLARRLPGRAGWELRLVVEGGLRILEKIDAMQHATLARRPRLGGTDAPRLLWRALTRTAP